MSGMDSLLDAFRSTPLGSLMADETPVSIYDTQLAWLDLPAPEFMEWVMECEPRMWDGIPPTADYFGRPTFAQVQAHRGWLTTELVRRHLPPSARLGVDVGSFPFSTPIALRQYLGYEGRIVGTINQRVDDDVLGPLASADIEVV